MKKIEKPTIQVRPEKRWLSPKELESDYDFAVSTQGKLRMERKIPFSKIGNYIRYDRIEINKWLEDNRVEMV